MTFHKSNRLLEGTYRVRIISVVNCKMDIGPPRQALKLKICTDWKHFAVRNFESDKMLQRIVLFFTDCLQVIHGLNFKFIAEVLTWLQIVECIKKL